MRRLRLLAAVFAVAGAFAAPASANPGASVTGGGSASDMTRFGLAVHNGSGHVECLMPAVMTVEAIVGSATAGGGWATLTGTATVTLAAHGLRPTWAVVQRRSLHRDGLGRRPGLRRSRDSRHALQGHRRARPDPNCHLSGSQTIQRE